MCLRRLCRLLMSSAASQKGRRRTRRKDFARNSRRWALMIASSISTCPSCPAQPPTRPRLTAPTPPRLRPSLLEASGSPSTSTRSPLSFDKPQPPRGPPGGSKQTSRRGMKRRSSKSKRGTMTRAAWLTTLLAQRMLPTPLSHQQRSPSLLKSRLTSPMECRRPRLLTKRPVDTMATSRPPSRHQTTKRSPAARKASRVLCLLRARHPPWPSHSSPLTSQKARPTGPVALRRMPVAVR
mmetsp:Transcript_13771/g.32788  ORF Transcript_13771/g.32788 Transcript_13771/m.32788 type:complete len:238 (+) Transcript_13771:109-822(+)